MVLGILAVLAGALGVWNFADSIWAASKKDHSVVRVQISLDAPQDQTAAGHVHQISLWDEADEFLGDEEDNWHLGAGTYVDVQIKQPDNRQATYALVEAGEDGICVAHISVTWPDDQKYMWTGSWGKECGAPWYTSKIFLDGHPLECMWIDGDPDDKEDIYIAISMHLPDFFVEQGEDFDKDIDHYCKDPKDDWIAPWFDKKAKSKARRSAQLPRRNATSVNLQDTEIVRSNLTAHIGTAAELCGSKSSRAPDFVSFEEGKYCDMAKKELWPLCQGTQVTDCFDADAQKMGKVQLGKRGEVVMTGKNYTRVHEWA